MQKHLFLLSVLATTLLACRPDTSDSTNNAQHPDSLATAPATPPGQVSEADAFLLAEGRAGRLEIGMPVSQIRNQLPPGYMLTDTVLQLEGQAYPSFWVHREGSTSGGLLVEQHCAPDCSVWRIRVSDPAFKTAAGVGVGTAFEEVQEQHPISFVSLAEAGVVAGATEENISFVIESTPLPQARLHQLKPADIPAGTPVKEIFIY